MLRFRTLAFAAVLAALPSISSASVVVVNQTLDVTQPQAVSGPSGFQGWQGTPAFNGGYNVAIAEGDTFDYTIMFAPGQSLTATGLSAVWAYSYTDGAGSDVVGTGTFSFLDASGNAILTSDSFTDTEGSYHFGQYFTSTNFAGGLPSPLTFYGVRYVGTLDDYLTSGVTTRDYNLPAFYLDAGNVAISAAVPEPASWAMMLGGLGLAGIVARLRKKVS